MLKIGIVTGEYPPHQGGVGDFSREIALALAALGHEVHVMTHVRARVDPSIHLHPMIRAWSLPSLFRVRDLARSISLEVVNIQYQAAAYGMTPPIHFLPSLLTVPSVVTFHDLRVPYLFPKAGPLRRVAVNFLARSAWGAIVTNPEDRLSLERDSKIKHLAEIPIGSNIKPFAVHYGIRNTQYASHWGFTEADVVVGYFGFLNASKGGETLFRAIAQLPDCKLLLIGGRTGTSDPTNTAYAAELDSLAAQLGVASRIVRTGYLLPDETTKAFLACDLMAMPYMDGASFRRGTFMACLAHGLPTISTLPAVPLPQLRDGENIRLVPPESPDALATAIRELAADLPVRTRLSGGALKLADQFTWDKIAERMGEFLTEILSITKRG
ncbi:MAG TPA: glycosyltransferase family 4 protein [Anaerolineales bacterium]|nr:glycosyltransferase family 4 protein [Anaerolineales bacterium]